MWETQKLLGTSVEAVGDAGPKVEIKLEWYSQTYHWFFLWAESKLFSLEQRLGEERVLLSNTLQGTQLWAHR